MIVGLLCSVGSLRLPLTLLQKLQSVHECIETYLNYYRHSTPRLSAFLLIVLSRLISTNVYTYTNTKLHVAVSHLESMSIVNIA